MGAEMAESGKQIDRLLAIMSRLRGEGGCPWDREQTLESLKQYLVEETYEVIDAIDSGDRSTLEEELGDLLLQIVFQSQICSEDGSFTFDDVAGNISDKLVRRHPHVFGDVQVADSDEVVRNWDAIKKDEKKERKSATDGVPRAMPALQRAHQIQKRAAKVGFDWDETRQVIDKIEEEIAEVKEAITSGREDRIREEMGDLLFAAVNLSRFLGHNAEEILDRTIEKFVTRFKTVEDKAHAEGKQVTDFSLAELDVFWEDAKRNETK
ncbi:MAG: nucleoside triphosphate pyrophosphohydrolase [Verrucomicrobia bacterium]|nr:nucleoside triphosphate pyrophosphohydrolase [Verrucomicrobiota bacterium]